MPRNGSGTYSLPAGNPVVTGTTISSSVQNTTMSDVANALTLSLAANGETPATGNLPMGGNKLIGLGPGTSAGDSLRFEQLFSQGFEQDIASSATTDIGAQNTSFLRVTGTTTITSFGLNYNGPRYLRFAGALTITNSATLACPGGNSIITVAGDVLEVYPLASGLGWQVQHMISANNLVSQRWTSVVTDINANFTASITTTVMTVTAVASGTIAVGQNVIGALSGTIITSLGTGTGGIGTYNISISQSFASGTLTTNTAPSFTITPSIIQTSYYVGQRFNIIFGSGGVTGSNTINISSLGAKNLKQYDSSGVKQPAIAALNTLFDIEYDGTDFVILNPLAAFPPVKVRQSIQYGPLTSPTAGNPAQPDLIPQSQINNTLATGVTLKCSVAPTLFSVSNGFSADGSPLDLNWLANTDLPVTGLPASTLGISIWVDPVLKTAGFYAVQDGDQPGGTIPITPANKLTFDYVGMKNYLATGAAAAQSNKLVVAEVDTDGTKVIAIRVRAYKREFEGTFITPLSAAATALVQSSNLGTVNKVTAYIEIECITSDAGYSVGDRVIGVVGFNGAYANPPTVLNRKNNTSANTGSSSGWMVVSNATGSSAILTLANWKWRFVAQSNWGRS